MFGPALQGRLPQRKPPNRPPTQKTVHARKNDVREVLNLKRRWSLHPQNQGGELRRAGRGLPWPLNLHRFSVSGDLAADDLVPMGYQFGRCKALPGKRVRKAFARGIGERASLLFAGLVHATPLCQIVTS